MIQCNQFIDASSSQFSKWTGNRVTFSDLNHCRIEKYAAATYSIKYVLRGTEHYFIDDKKYSVSSGHFLLVNKRRSLDFTINSRQKVSGFCIHIEERTMQDVYTQLVRSEEKRLDDPALMLDVPEFEETIYNEAESCLGKYLKQIALSYRKHTGTIPVEPTALYDHLSHNLLLTQNSYLKGTGNLTAVKHSTKRELLRRLELAKEIMNVNDPNTLNMEAIARQAMLSGSHFFRSFKRQYGVSPYQYALQLKLDRSAQLLRKNRTTITDVALSNGFADIASFSKAFKKQFGSSPMQFMQNN